MTWQRDDNWQSDILVPAPLDGLPRLYAVFHRHQAAGTALTRLGGSANRTHAVVQLVLTGRGRLHAQDEAHVLTPGMCVIGRADQTGIAFGAASDGPGWTCLGACLGGPARDIAMAMAAGSHVLTLARPALLRAAITAPGTGRRPVHDAYANARAALAVADALLAAVRLHDELPLHERALALITGHYRVTVTQLAQQLGVTREHLSRSFREAGLAPPQHLIAERRCAEAARRLRARPDAIQVIARELGYGDAATFSRAFTRIVGRSPQAYRQHERS